MIELLNMMLFGQADAVFEGASYSKLLWPGILFSLGSAAAVWICWRNTEAVNDWLVRNTRGRVFFFVLLLIVFPVLIIGLTDWTDISEVAKGHVRADDAILLSIAAFLVVVYFCAMCLWFQHANAVNEHLSKAKSDLEKEGFTHELTRTALRSFIRVANIFMNQVELKSRRTRVAIKKYKGDSAEVRLRKIEAALSPKEQIVQLITNLHLLYSARLEPGFRLRVALFISEDAYMVPIHSWDGITTECVCRPGTEHRQHFKLDSGDSLLAKVARDRAGKIVIVTDAEKASEEKWHPFRYYDDSDREAIKSLVCMPIRRGNVVPHVHPVFCIDTNEPDFFNEGQRKEIEAVRDHVSSRLLLELDMIELLKV